MSTVGRYIFHYEPQPYRSPEPWVTDGDYLRQTHGGEVIPVGPYDWFWEKPTRGALVQDEIRKLLADQVLESCDGNDWRDVTARPA